jgi:hypothetical protein
MRPTWMSRRGTTVTAAALVLAIGALTLVASQAPGTTAGYIASVRNSNDTASTNANFTCAGVDTTDRAALTGYFQFYLNDPTFSTFATNQVTGNIVNGVYANAITNSATTPVACPRDTGGSWLLNGTSSALYSNTSVTLTTATPLTLSVWFKTTVAGGMLLDFGSSQTGLSGQHDRHLYLTTTGQVDFGVYNGQANVITSPLAYNDGLWHQAVATFSSTAGTALYMDGKLVISGSTFTAAEAHAGYFRIGYDSLSGWPGTASNYYFTGSLRFASGYAGVLTATQIASDYAAGAPK